MTKGNFCEKLEDEFGRLVNELVYLHWIALDNNPFNSKREMQELRLKCRGTVMQRVEKIIYICNAYYMPYRQQSFLNIVRQILHRIYVDAFVPYKSLNGTLNHDKRNYIKEFINNEVSILVKYMWKLLKREIDNLYFRLHLIKTHKLNIKYMK